MSERNSYILMLVGGVILGILLFFGVQNRSAISDWFAQLLKQEPKQEEEEDSYPYFAAGIREYYLGEDSEWKFQVFQPEVSEYISDEDTGLNYVELKYFPDDDLSKEYKVKTLLTVNEDGWFPESAGFGLGVELEDLSFDHAISTKIRMLKSFDGDKADREDNPSNVTLAVFKSTFPVGSRVSMMVPVSYPNSSQRTDLYCASFDQIFQYICDYGTVVDKLSEGLDDFNEQKEVSEDFILVPYYFSGDLTSESDLD